MRRSLVFLFLALALMSTALLAAARPAQAQGQGHAGLVVLLGDDRLETRCVAVDASNATGYKMLEQSGLDLAVDAQGMGVAVCGIEGVGCPANDCFCACKGGDECNYWSYWTYENDTWRYSQNGAGREQVVAGEVQGWSWGPGAVNSAEAPPIVPFDAICTAEIIQSAAATPTLPASTIDWRSIASFGVIMTIVGGSWVFFTRLRRQPT